MENKKENPYSYHTFFFPFIWEGEDEKPKEKDEIIKILNKNVWIEEEKLFETQEYSQEIKYLYQTMQYYHLPVRNAIFKGENEVVHTYRFLPNIVSNKASYCIYKGNKEEPSYELLLNNIRLKIYNTGVGILIFECENIKENQRNIEAVKDINEYGRRITTPFLPSSEEGVQLCADKIEIKIAGLSYYERGFESDSIETDFTKVFPYKEKYKSKSEIPFTYIADFILKLLSGGEKAKVQFVSDKEKLDKKCWLIYPALDDRMYVACIVQDDNYAEKVKEAKLKKDKKITETEDEKLKKDMRSLYELAYIDRENEISCPTYRMMVELLNEQIYDRWLEYGTCYIVTHHSFVCITENSESVKATVIIPFLILYTEMVLLCLAQRSSIILFQKRAALFTKDMAGHKRKLKGKNRTRLIDLQESYIAFQNQLMFFEVTSQEQGIELYDMICNSLYIEKERERLENQINIAYEAINVYQGENLNIGGLILSLLALSMSVFSCCNDICNFEKDEIFMIPMTVVILIVLAIIIIIWNWKIKSR